MGKIIIKRLPAMLGSAVKMNCFIGGSEICKLKENETFVINYKEGIYRFECKLSYNPMSDVYKIDVSKNKNVEIDVKQGFWKPSVEIYYTSEVSDEIKNAEKINDFKPTKSVDEYLYIDEMKKEWAIPEGTFSKKIKNIYSYSDILNFELLEDGNSLIKGGLGNAIIGGTLFGDVGAIVGSNFGKKQISTCNLLQIKITLKNIENPVIYINLISNNIKKDSMLYKYAFQKAQKIMSLFQIMYNDNNSYNTNKFNTNISPADEIKKYKELLDSGAITQDEYDAKKKELLDL